MKTISPLALALCASFALLSVVSAKAIADAEAKPEAEAGVAGIAGVAGLAGLTGATGVSALHDVTDYRFANSLAANTLINPYADLRRGLNGFRGGLATTKNVVPLESQFAFRGLNHLAPIYTPTEFTGYGTAASLEAQARLRGVSAARAALLNQAIANQYYNNLLRNW